MPSHGRIHEQASIGFQRAADAYERGRPDYPTAAVGHLLRVLKIGAGSRIVELGAGTGKFTKALVARGADVVAVEPVEAMRRKLGELLPEISIVDGTAEAIPLADASVDAVVAAQAFHWFRADEAVAEIHRVLKADGRLGLIWNARDDANEWNRELTRIIEAHEGSTPRYKSFAWRAAFDNGHLFSPLEKAEFPHVQTMSREAVEDRVGSISFIAALPETNREAVLKQVRELVERESANRAESRISLPYRTDVYTCRRI
jgi:SAM-dependent methyltransferase